MTVSDVNLLSRAQEPSVFKRGCDYPHFEPEVGGNLSCCKYIVSEPAELPSIGPDKASVEDSLRLCEAKYKVRERADEHARNFPAVMEEIEKRRDVISNAKYTDQSSAEYQDFFIKL